MVFLPLFMNSSVGAKYSGYQHFAPAEPMRLGCGGAINISSLRDRLF